MAVVRRQDDGKVRVKKEEALAVVHRLLDELGQGSCADYYRANHVPAKEIEILGGLILRMMSWMERNQIVRE